MSHSASGLNFSKLEALGNDFVLLDLRAGGADPAAALVRMLADRHTGIGFDQLLTLHSADTADADCRVQIYNADGSHAQQCGNGMRAVALWLHQSNPDQKHFVLETASGPVSAEIESAHAISAGMGLPNFDPATVGLQTREPLEQLVPPIPGCLGLGTVSVGNPHLIILLEHPAAPELVEQTGRELSQLACFADGVNVSFACVEAPDRVVLRVHERGVGPTLACGSAACATAAWLIHQDLVQPPVRVEQPGGALVINWRGARHPILMKGPARRVFDGTMP